jgi:hypothetical protein
VCVCALERDFLSQFFDKNHEKMHFVDDLEEEEQDHEVHKEEPPPSTVFGKAHAALHRAFPSTPATGFAWHVTCFVGAVVAIVVFGDEFAM